MIVTNWCKGNDTINRLPNRWDDYMILEKTENEIGKKGFEKVCRAPYMLLQDVTSKKILKSLESFNEIKIDTLQDLYHLLNCKEAAPLFTLDNIKYVIENQLHRKVVLFQKSTHKTDSRRSKFHQVYENIHCEYTPIFILLPNDRMKLYDESENVITKFILMTNTKLSEKTTYVCNECGNPFQRRDSLLRHLASKEGCNTESIVTPKQKVYGIPENVEQELLEAGLIDQAHVGFRQDNFLCWDIETLESPNLDETREEATLNLVSISLMASFEENPVCLTRKGDKNSDIENLVFEFLALLELKALEFEARTPSKFNESLIYMKTKEDEQKAIQKQCNSDNIPAPKIEFFPHTWKNYLQNKVTFKCFSFNGSKFDNKFITNVLFKQKTDQKITINVLKMGSKYFNICYDHNNIIISFCDVMNFVSPCSLSSFIKMCNIVETKSIFPYQHFRSIAELEECEDFPEYDAFYSDLKSGHTCTFEEYELAKLEFDMRLSLDDHDPDKMYNMLCWLRYYNNLDVSPLVESIKVWFSGFYAVFGIDPYDCQSLPSMAQKAMMKLYDTKSPALFSLPKKGDELTKLFRQNCIGGLVSNPHRMITMDPTLKNTSPEAAYTAPNGDEYSALIAYDFNSLYPWGLLQEMPCGPGVLWQLNKDGKSFWKKSMCQGSSFEELQFIMFLQYHDSRFDAADGRKVQIEHGYHRGQKKIAGYDVDGFAMVNGKPVIIEYNGCYFHQPCPHEGCKFHESYNDDNKDSNGQFYQWYTKEQNLNEWVQERNGTLLTVWGCQVSMYKHRDLETSFMPRALKLVEKNDNDCITKLIMDEEIFGFIQCDLSTADEIKEKFKTLNFPPIVRRQEITEDILSEYQIEMLKLSNRKLPIKTVVNAWEGKGVLMFTPYLKFLIELGVKISKIQRFIQYTPSKCFSKFVNTCVKGRIEAGSDKTKLNSFKVSFVNYFQINIYILIRLR